MSGEVTAERVRGNPFHTSIGIFVLLEKWRDVLRGDAGGGWCE